MTNGYVTNKPYLGITGGSMTAQMAAQYRYDISEGVFVFSVEDGGAADKAGVQMGDVITKVGDNTIKTMEDLTVAKKQYASGDTTTFTVNRQGQVLTMDVTWDAVPKQEKAPVQEEQAPTQGGPMNPNDLFNYFFGGGFNGSSARNPA